MAYLSHIFILKNLGSKYYALDIVDKTAILCYSISLVCSLYDRGFSAFFWFISIQINLKKVGDSLRSQTWYALHRHRVGTMYATHRGVDKWHARKNLLFPGFADSREHSSRSSGRSKSRVGRSTTSSRSSRTPITVAISASW